LALFAFIGCEECEDCPPPTAPSDTNHTDIDPPFIRWVSGPAQVVVGGSAQFDCEILSDAEIIRKSWNLDLFAGDYFYPAIAEEGYFTPEGARPYPFAETDTGDAPSFVYENRGMFTVGLEIEDEDGYIEHSGTMIEVIPETPDDGSIHVLYAAMTDTILGANFDLQRFSLIAEPAYPACVYSDGFGQFAAYSFIESDSMAGYRIIRSSAEVGKLLGIEGSGWFLAYIELDFDVEGALHIWGDNPADMVEYSVYFTVKHVDGLPRTNYLYSKRLTPSDGEAFYLKNSYFIEDTVRVMGNELYEFWFGMETFQYHAPGQSGSAVCFDGVPAPTRLNRAMFTLDK